MVMPRLGPLLQSVAALAAVACQAQVAVNQPGGPPAPAPARNDGGMPPMGPVFTVPDASDTAAPAPVGPPGPGPACARSTVEAQQASLDVLLLMDNSGSMTGKAGGRSKWQIAQESLVAFASDGRSAGLGLGLQFFPSVTEPMPCQGDADCPGSICSSNEICVGSSNPMFEGFTCLPPDFMPRCFFGAACAIGGLCTASKQPCRTPGQACPSGLAGDTCQAASRVCEAAEDGRCDGAVYEEPAVAIGTLPGNAEALVARIRGRMTAGGTPTSAALAGSYRYLRRHLAANPGRRAALVLVTDGLPTGCEPIAPAGIAAGIRRERMQAPGILTYAIGVFSPEDVGDGRPALQMFAAAGGTGTPFVITANADLGASLNRALADIRGQAVVPCEFVIPPAMGGTIDFGKVNVSVNTGTAEETIPYVRRAAACDPARGGWHYDVEPGTGAATPARVVLCPASCSRFQAATAARVNVVFGCETKVID
jgi:hypothetical protein